VPQVRLLAAQLQICERHALLWCTPSSALEGLHESYSAACSIIGVQDTCSTLTDYCSRADICQCHSTCTRRHAREQVKVCKRGPCVGNCPKCIAVEKMLTNVQGRSAVQGFPIMAKAHNWLIPKALANIAQVRRLLCNCKVRACALEPCV
jgi:hypothetical protein